MYAVHPAGVRREAHDEERVMRKRDALRCALHRRATVTVGSMFPIGTLLAPSGDNVLFRPERHGAPRSEGDIHDARAAHDVDCLVRVFRDVVRAGAVQLNEHVIHRVL